MNKKVMGGVAIAIVGIVGVTGYKIYNVNKTVDQMMNSIDEISKEIPNPFSAKNNLNKGVFSSDGEYVVTVKEEGEQFNVKLKYHINHGLMEYFTSSYPITGKVTISDTVGIVDGLKIPNNEIMNIDGKFLSNGDMHLDGKSIALKIDELGIDVSPLSVKYNFNKNTQVAEASVNIDSMKKEEFKIKGINFNISAPINNILVGSLTSKIDFVDTPFAKIKGLTANYYSTKNNDKYNYGLKFNVEQAKSLMTKADLTAKFDVSVKDVDAKYTENYYKMMKDKSIDKIDVSKLDVAQLFRKGFSINLNELSYKDGENKLLGQANVIFKPDASNEIDLVKNTEISIKFNAEGGLMNFVKMMADPKYFEEQGNDAKQLFINYKEQKLIVNNKLATEDDQAKLMDNLTEYSQSINNLSNPNK